MAGKKRYVPKPDRAARDIRSKFGDFHHRAELDERYEVYNQDRYSQYSKEVQEYAKKNPKDMAALQERNTEAQNKLLNGIAFADHLRDDPVSRFALDRTYYNSRVPLGFEEESSVTPDSYAFNYNYSGDEDRGQVFIAGKPAGSERLLPYVARHEGSHDLEMQEESIRLLDRLYSDYLIGKDRATMRKTNLKPSEHREIFGMLQRNLARAGNPEKLQPYRETKPDAEVINYFDPNDRENILKAIRYAGDKDYNRTYAKTKDGQYLYYKPWFESDK